MSEETTESTGTTAEAGKRPVFLTVLCILSFIAIGFGLIAYVTAIGLATAATAVGVETAASNAGMIWAYIIVGFITAIVSLFGVIKMWKLKKQGFMLYAGASVASMIMGVVYSGFNVVALIIPIAFIVMYYLNLKHMD